MLIKAQIISIGSVSALIVKRILIIKAVGRDILKRERIVLRERGYYYVRVA